MHGPENSWEDNFKVWGAMEEGFDQGKVKQLGISNWYRLEDIQYLYDHARIKPKVKLMRVTLHGTCACAIHCTQYCACI
jgi:diketogulonate reductase-like aldo/keto reductase